MNECYCYFHIIGEFDPADITKFLGIEPFRAFKKGELRRGGRSRYDFSTFCCCRCDEYDFDANVMIEKTIAPLRDKIEILNRLRELLGVEYEICVVPKIHVDESTPALGASLSVIDFCHEIRANIDIDMYLFN